MSDQPKPPDQSKAPEQKAPDKPDSAKPPVDTSTSKEAPKAAGSLASPKSTPATPEKSAEQQSTAGVKAASGDEATERAIKVPPSKPEEAPASAPKPAEAPAQDAPKPGVSPAQPTNLETSAAQSEPAQPTKPPTAPLDAEKPAAPASPATSAAQSDPTQPSKPPTESSVAEKPAAPDKPAAPASPTPGAPTTSTKPLPSSASAPGDADQPASLSESDKPAAPSPATSVTGTAPLSPPPGAPSQPAAPPQPAATMQQRCPNCGHRNRPGVLVCENCGTNLVTGKASVAGTRDLLREQEEQEAGISTASARPGTAPLVDSAELKAVQSAGSSVFEENMVLRIEIEGGATPILVYPKQEIIFGRRDPTSGGMPDVDLTPYAGYRMGVSRRHAAIRLQDKRLDVSDLGSSNGTFLNGTRLSAHRPYQLRDGDEIRLGQMVMRVFFQTNTGRK